MLFWSDENCCKNEFFEFQVLTHPCKLVVDCGIDIQ